MKRSIFVAAILLSSICSAFADQLANCYPTRDAMAYASENHIKFTVLRGASAAGLISEMRKLGNLDIKTVHFVALARDGDSVNAFIGNISEVCGPFILSKELVNMVFRPI